MALPLRSGVKFLCCAALALALPAVAPTPATAQAQKKLPYWVAISKDEARMRVGPSMDYPANWIYRRKNLPLKVIEVYPNWRRIEDPDGTKGWMHVRLLKDDRTAIVIGETVALRADPSNSARALYRAEPGVVGRVTDCDDGWCMFDVHGQRGYIPTRNLWGATSE
ncbi:SH3 domain-containing protein [Sphingobium sufflavum]|uniref:SH3 domain-containing protein n=1 Tax=Sphingobium sufflavum TaxID=1129547 RepID=UPI001EFF4681|nr:SH3 domain-containing protein [Sphingobium sufflavum]